MFSTNRCCLDPPPALKSCFDNSSPFLTHNGPPSLIAFRVNPSSIITVTCPPPSTLRVSHCPHPFPFLLHRVVASEIRRIPHQISIPVYLFQNVPRCDQAKLRGNVVSYRILPRLLAHVTLLQLS